jgi:hypothetical protein
MLALRERTLTVETTNSREQYATNGTTGPWAVGFYFLADADLRVVHTSSAGVETTLALTADYSVTGAGVASGGFVTTVAAYAAGGYVTIVRDVDALQPIDLADTDSFPADTLERSLDRLTMLVQQQQERLDRAVQFPVTDELGATLPAASARASKQVHTDANGQFVFAAPVSGTAVDVLIQLILSTGSSLVGHIHGATGAVATTVQAWMRRQTRDTYADYGIVPDGSTDRTAALVALLAQLTTDGFRGTLRIPLDTKFNVTTVHDAVTTGIRLDDQSGSCNWTDGSYKQKHRIFHNADLVADDSQMIESSSYHPAMGGFNSGKSTTDQTDSAARRYFSILHHFGKSLFYNSYISGWMMQFGKSPSANKWRFSLRTQTPLVVGMADAQGLWIAGKTYTTGDHVRNATGACYKATSTGAAGATPLTGTGTSISDGAQTWNYIQAQPSPEAWAINTVYGVDARVINDGERIYKCTTRGTSAASGGPTGTGTGIADGTAVWAYEQASLNIDSTRFDLTEDGDAGFYGPLAARLTQAGGANSHYIEVDSSGNLTWRDVTRGADIWSSTTTGGVRSGRLQSFNRSNTTISASGVLVLTAPMHYLTASGGPWEITDITIPSGQTSGTVVLWFGGTNLTLKNNANIVTRTGADISSAANMMVTLYKDTSISSSWVVMSKN